MRYFFTRNNKMMRTWRTGCLVLYLSVTERVQIYHIGTTILVGLSSKIQGTRWWNWVEQEQQTMHHQRSNSARVFIAPSCMYSMLFVFYVINQSITSHSTVPRWNAFIFNGASKKSKIYWKISRCCLANKSMSHMTDRMIETYKLTFAGKLTALFL